jgi:uncharacterized protein (DUF1697 family)
MPVRVALIRAIGPVTHARMGMAALRAACVSAGLAEVATVGNTGNLLLRSDQPPDAVRKLVQAAVNGFGLENEVFLDTPRKMARVVAANPFPDAAASRPRELGVCTFHRAPDWTPIAQWDGPERCAMIGAHLVVDYPAGVPKSRLRIEKLLGATMTQRNWTVFAGLAAKAAALGRG